MGDWALILSRTYDILVMSFAVIFMAGTILFTVWVVVSCWRDRKTDEKNHLNTCKAIIKDQDEEIARLRLTNDQLLGRTTEDEEDSLNTDLDSAMSVETRTKLYNIVPEWFTDLEGEARGDTLEELWEFDSGAFGVDGYQQAFSKPHVMLVEETGSAAFIVGTDYEQELLNEIDELDDDGSYEIRWIYSTVLQQELEVVRTLRAK